MPVGAKQERGEREESGAGVFIFLVSSLQGCHELAMSQWSQLLSRGYTAPSHCPCRPRGGHRAHCYQSGALHSPFLQFLCSLPSPCPMNDAYTTSSQYNQAEVAFKELAREEMKDSESFDTLFTHLEKAKTGIESYSCVALFKQMEEFMACVLRLQCLRTFKC